MALHKHFRISILLTVQYRPMASTSQFRNWHPLSTSYHIVEMYGGDVPALIQSRKGSITAHTRVIEDIIHIKSI